MEALFEVIQKVRARIQKHGDALRNNEMLTRYALVDPILRALGWDTEDPDAVEPEFRLETGRPDYALKHEGQPLIMVEAKSLRGAIDQAREEGFRYCWRMKVPFYVITDGNRWELHDLREMGGREVFRIELMSEGLGDAARKLMALWRPAMPSVEPAPPLLISLPAQPPAAPAVSTGLRSIPLGQLEQRLGQLPRPRQHPPQSVRFPDGTAQPAGRWRALLVAVARWALPRLQASGQLLLEALIQKDPNRLRASRRLSEGWHIEVHLSAKACIHNAVRIARAAGVDPDQITVEFAP
jgi:hypothetical protein